MVKMNFVNSLLPETNCKYKSRKNTDCENRSLDSKITLYKQDFVNIIFIFFISIFLGCAQLVSGHANTPESVIDHSFHCQLKNIEG